MRTRPFGKAGFDVSILGFGCMRLPTIGGDTARIDEPLATRMLHSAIDAGVNYVDTAYGYHKGESERFVGRALRGGWRSRVRLATKMPMWKVEAASDFDRLLNEQMEKLQTDHIDCYLLHALNAERWDKGLSLGVLEWAERAIAAGRIGRLGFSFHDKHETFPRIIDGWDKWSFCQIQYNYMDEDNQAGTKGLRYAHSRGLAVVVMEPLLGGNLTSPPAPIAALWDTAARRRTPVEWALAWLWSKSEVSVVLSGMSAMEHVDENVRLAKSTPALEPDELALVGRVRDRYRDIRPVPCTQCEYCLPCPQGVAIPRVFRIYNDGAAFNNTPRAKKMHANIEEGKNATACIECRECEPKCPQGIEIGTWMPRIAGELAV
jgi:uncharacterized protein